MPQISFKNLIVVQLQQMEKLGLLTLESLNAYLISHQVPTSEWGKGESKKLEHLLKELNKGECKLIESEDGSLVRVVRGVGINIFYKSGEGKLLKLKEDRQVFSDGRTRRRVLSTSVGEKLQPGETPEQAATRTLEEELQIFGYSFSDYETVDKDLVISTSFPGLYTRNTIHVFDRFLEDKDFREEGYIEIQEDKTSYFLWEPKDMKAIDF